LNSSKKTLSSMMELQEVQLHILFSFHSYDFPQYDRNVS
jgi:hypothetical protein